MPWICSISSPCSRLALSFFPEFQPNARCSHPCPFSEQSTRTKKRHCCRTYFCTNCKSQSHQRKISNFRFWQGHYSYSFEGSITQVSDKSWFAKIKPSRWNCKLGGWKNLLQEHNWKCKRLLTMIAHCFVALQFEILCAFSVLDLSIYQAKARIAKARIYWKPKIDFLKRRW